MRGGAGSTSSRRGRASGAAAPPALAVAAGACAGLFPLGLVAAPAGAVALGAFELARWERRGLAAAPPERRRVGRRPTAAARTHARSGARRREREGARAGRAPVRPVERLRSPTRHPDPPAYGAAALAETAKSGARDFGDLRCARVRCLTTSAETSAAASTAVRVAPHPHSRHVPDAVYLPSVEASLVMRGEFAGVTDAVRSTLDARAARASSATGPRGGAVDTPAAPRPRGPGPVALDALRRPSVLDAPVLGPAGPTGPPRPIPPPHTS
jgi:hypothetical protein